MNSNERHQYCKQLDYDVLGLTELHNKQKIKECMGRRWTMSEIAEVQDGRTKHRSRRRRDHIYSYQGEQRQTCWEEDMWVHELRG